MKQREKIRVSRTRKPYSVLGLGTLVLYYKLWKFTTNTCCLLTSWQRISHPYSFHFIWFRFESKSMRNKNSPLPTKMNFRVFYIIFFFSRIAASSAYNFSVWRLNEIVGSNKMYASSFATHSCARGFLVSVVSMIPFCVSHLHNWWYSILYPTHIEH